MVFTIAFVLCNLSSFVKVAGFVSCISEDQGWRFCHDVQFRLGGLEKVNLVTILPGLQYKARKGQNKNISVLADRLCVCRWHSVRILQYTSWTLHLAN